PADEAGNRWGLARPSGRRKRSEPHGERPLRQRGEGQGERGQAVKVVRSKVDPDERRCRSCSRLLRASSSRQVRLCTPCSKARPGYENRIRALLHYAKLRKRRSTIRLQLSQNGN